MPRRKDATKRPTSLKSNNSYQHNGKSTSPVITSNHSVHNNTAANLHNSCPTSPTNNSSIGKNPRVITSSSSLTSPMKKIVTFLARSTSRSTSEDGAAVGDEAGSSSTSGYYIAPYGRGMRPVPSMNTLNRLERQNIVLWRKPVQTLHYFCRELAIETVEYVRKLWYCKKLLTSLLAVGFFLYFAYTTPGPHSKAIAYVEKKLFWCSYWIFLGVLSSVGLGTGLHTFLLYLGPHIASVTLAAYECQSLKFPEPPYPEQIICPSTVSAGNFMNSSRPTAAEDITADSGGETGMDALAASLTTLATSSVVSLWAIMGKVRVEAFMWGAGTALGELPPYFMARAARLSGEEPDDEEYREFVQFIRSQNSGQQASWWSSAKMAVEKIVEGIGFVGILLCASIPNPLFDLAGITCGHFLVPFWTFFGATLIGKAVVKMHIQLGVVCYSAIKYITMNLLTVPQGLMRITHIPKIGPPLQAPFKDYLKQQKTKLHRSPGDPIHVKKSLVQTFFDLLVVVMVAFFIVSIVNSLAQSYHRRLCERAKTEKEVKHR